MSVRTVPFEKCTGCGACSNICPKNAVNMRPDKYGFIYPDVDLGKCISCNLCSTVCPETVTTVTNTPFEAYAATINNHTLLSLSSSGGVFAGLAMSVLTNGGLVAGASMDENLCVNTILIENEASLHLLQGSKYVQSNIGKIYSQIKDALKEGRKVLFCGCPCQVAALKNYTGTDASSLYLIDLTCHGVPSSHMFEDYISYVAKKKNIRIENFSFRDKRFGQDFVFKLDYIKNDRHVTKSFPATKSSFFKLFLSGSLFRPNCHSCQYACEKRTGDITICDYWGIEKEHPDFCKTVKEKGLSGISGVLINTKKGKELFDSCKESFIYIPTEFNKIAAHNEQLLTPSRANPNRRTIMDLYANQGFSSVDKYYRRKYFFKILRAFVGSLIPIDTRRKINSFFRKGMQ